MASSKEKISNRVLIDPKEPDLYIKNRNGKKLGVWVKGPENPRGVAFLSHGQLGTTRDPIILQMRDALISRGVKVISYDASNSYCDIFNCHFNYSEGYAKNLTWSSQYYDLEDVIKWAK